MYWIMHQSPSSEDMDERPQLSSLLSPQSGHSQPTYQPQQQPSLIHQQLSQTQPLIPQHTPSSQAAPEPKHPNSARTSSVDHGDEHPVKQEAPENNTTPRSLQPQQPTTPVQSSTHPPQHVQPSGPGTAHAEASHAATTEHEKPDKPKEQATPVAAAQETDAPTTPKQAVKQPAAKNEKPREEEEAQSPEEAPRTPMRSRAVSFKGDIAAPKPDEGSLPNLFVSSTN